MDAAAIAAIFAAATTSAMAATGLVRALSHAFSTVATRIDYDPDRETNLNSEMGMNATSGGSLDMQNDSVERDICAIDLILSHDAKMSVRSTTRHGTRRNGGGTWFVISFTDADGAIGLPTGETAVRFNGLVNSMGYASALPVGADIRAGCYYFRPHRALTTALPLAALVREVIVG